MGLLDTLDSDQFRLGMGLLAAGGARGDGASFGQRMQEGFGSLDAYRKQKAEQEFRQMQMEEARAKIAQERAQAQESARIRTLMAGAGKVSPGMGATGQVNSALPSDLRIGAMPALQTAGQIDYQELIRQGVPIEQVRALAESRNFGMNKVARTAEVEGPNGSKIIQSFDDYNNPVGQGAQGYVAPVSVNQGNQTSFVKPVAGLSLPMGMSPAEQSAANDRNRSFGLQRERLNFDQANNQNGKAPAGYRWKPDGSMEAIPGGPAAGNKLTESEGKSTLYLSQMRDATKVINGIKGDVSPIGVAATGSTFTNWMTDENSQKAGQAQRQWAEAYLREKTGAAATAGEVENNIKTFFPVVGDSAAVIKQKKSARAEAENAMQIPAGRGVTRLGAEGSWGDNPKPAGQAPIPMKGMVRNGYKFKGGDPSNQSNWEQQ